MKKQSKVLVIGAGVVGLACAEVFAREGWNVVILDRHLAGAGQTTRTGGGIRYAHGSELNVQLSVRSHPTWEHFAQRFGVDVDYRQTGHLFLTVDAKQVSSFGTQAKMHASAGLPSEVLTADEVHARWPQLQIGNAAYGLYCASGGYLNHHRVVDGYVRELLKRGASLEVGRRLDNLVTQHGAVSGVSTSHGIYEADLVINAAGPAAGRFLRQVGQTDPFVNHRHELLIVQPHQAVPAEIPWLIDTDQQVHLRPDGAGRALIGGFLGHDKPSNPESFDHCLTEQWAKNVRQAACKAFGLNEPSCHIVEGWAGLYPGTQDYLPVAEVTCPGLITIAGMSGTGLMHAPAMSEIAWSLATSNKPAWIDIKQLTTARFDQGVQQMEGTGF